MNIYLLTQDKNTGYDTFDSVIVVAKNEDEAKGIHPYGGGLRDETYGTWVPNKEDVTCELIGKAIKEYKTAGVILASFNAG